MVGGRAGPAGQGSRAAMLTRPGWQGRAGEYAGEAWLVGRQGVGRDGAGVGGGADEWVRGVSREGRAGERHRRGRRVGLRGGSRRGGVERSGRAGRGGVRWGAARRGGQVVGRGGQGGAGLRAGWAGRARRGGVVGAQAGPDGLGRVHRWAWHSRVGDSGSAHVSLGATQGAVATAGSEAEASNASFRLDPCTLLSTPERGYRGGGAWTATFRRMARLWEGSRRVQPPSAH